MPRAPSGSQLQLDAQTFQDLWGKPTDQNRLLIPSDANPAIGIVYDTVPRRGFSQADEWAANRYFITPVMAPGWWWVARHSTYGTCTRSQQKKIEIHVLRLTSVSRSAYHSPSVTDNFINSATRPSTGCLLLMLKSGQLPSSSRDYYTQCLV